MTSSRPASFYSMVAKAASRVLLKADAATPAKVHMCWTAHSGMHWIIAAQYFAMQHYAPQFPNLDIAPVMVGQPNAATSDAGVAAGLIEQAGNCTVIFGPGGSERARRLSLLIDAPLWLSFAATGTDLSDTNKYPNFHRVIPNDEAGALTVVRLLRSFGWTSVNAVAVDALYGRSFVEAVSTIGADNAGPKVTVAQQRVLPTTASNATIDGWLLSLRESDTRVVVAALDVNLLPRLRDRLVANGMTNEFYFVFSESACAGSDKSWLNITGAFCPVFTVNTTRKAAFESAYWQRTNQATMEPIVRAATGTGGSFPPQQRSLGTYEAFSVDAVVFSMAVLDKYYSQTPQPPVQIKPPLTDLRKFASGKDSVRYDGGMTGAVFLNAAGDRDASDSSVLNVYDGRNGLARPVRVIGASGALTTTSDAFFAQHGYATTAPTYLSPKALAGPPAADRTVLYVAVSIGVALVIAAVVAVLVYVLLRRCRLGRYPRDSSAPFACFFVSVKNEAVLRDFYGTQAAMDACRSLEGMIDSAAAAEGCHVARRLDAHFMVVGKHPEQVLRAIARIVKSHHLQSWSTFLKTPIRRMRNRGGNSSRSSIRSASQRSHSKLSSSPDHRRQSTGVRSGSDTYATTTSSTATLLISVGCSFHHGRIVISPENEFDVRYSCVPVDRAAALTDAARVGQVLVAEDVVAALQANGTASQFEFDEVAERRLAAPPTETGKPQTANVVVHQFDTPGVPRRTYADEVVRVDSHSGSQTPEEEMDAAPVGALTSALEEASGGFATRHIASVVFQIPALRSRRTLLSEAHGVVAAIAAVAKEEKGAVVSVGDGFVHVVVNAVGPPVSQAPQRAVTIAFTAMDDVSQKFGVGISAGVECGAAAVGVSGTGGSSVVTCTSVLQRATMLSTMARNLSTANIVNRGDFGESNQNTNAAPSDDDGPCKPMSPVYLDLTSLRALQLPDSIVLASHAAKGEVEVRFGARAVDVCAFPPSEVTSADAAVGSGSPTSVPKGAAGAAVAVPVRPVPVHVLSPGEATGGEDDEWMYQLSTAERNDPFAKANAAMVALAAGDDVMAEQGAAPVGSAAAANCVVRSVLDAVKGVRCVEGTFTDKVAVYAKARANAATMAFPVA